MAGGVRARPERRRRAGYSPTFLTAVLPSMTISLR